MHYYSFHIGDYVRDTARLSPIEDIAYRRLLDVYYSKERPLNGCSTDVALEIGLQDYQPEVDRVLKKYFTKDGDNWVNNRVEREIQAYHDKQEKASKAGKASGRARRNKRSTDDEQTLNQPLTNNHKPITNLKDMSSKHDDSVDKVFEHWKTRMGKNAATKLTAERKTKIKARLSDGYTVDQICSAIDGCAGSDFHMGKNDQSTVYDDLTLICRSGDKLEYFINNIGKIQSGGVSGRRKESLAERSARETAEILADIEAREAHSGPVGANDPIVRPQVAERARSSQDGERGVLDGVFTVVQENGTSER